MNIQQLETFCWISRLGTFSAAADRLYTSQASVSSRIRELEMELDVVLFDRIGRQVQLTLKGRELLVHAEKVVIDASQLRLVAGKPEITTGVVKIGLGEVIAARSLVAIINTLKQRYPGLAVEFDIDLNASLLSKLSRGAIDVAVVGGPIHDGEINAVSIGALKVVWVGTPVLSAQLAIATPRDIAALPIISLNREARLFTQMQSWFAEAAVVPGSVSFCNSMSTMLYVARGGVCVCMMPHELVKDDLEAGTLCALNASPSIPSITFFVATRVDSLDPAIADFAAIVTDICRLPPTSD
ncbi:LysR family transcriptional regulator [Glaciimonas immobilis]|uniref:DNA-binding transcriptional LysR family regulator n=1 Tax=Glaciimonas immobilis TaxID=728004 RepID=A0A840RXB1_9BURK|nr:LysR family transcriptional regulator [Glaciimonas immobilis]KAF3996470.1 LysR family transcriptional regulator [Glaciimonas immobilis]MBB5201181.1 DNA-binding transcriptional LysR family regulator [Glaciimonas immobilis]